MNGSYDLPTNGVLTGVRTTTDPITFWSQHFPGSQNIHLQHPPKNLEPEIFHGDAMQPGVAPNKPAIQKKDTTTKLEAVPAPTHGGRMFGQKKPSVSAVGFWKGGKIHPPKNTQTIDTVYFLTVFLFVGFTVWGPKNHGKNHPIPIKVFSVTSPTLQQVG